MWHFHLGNWTGGKVEWRHLPGLVLLSMTSCDELREVRRSWNNKDGWLWLSSFNGAVTFLSRENRNCLDICMFIVWNIQIVEVAASSSSYIQWWCKRDWRDYEKAWHTVYPGWFMTRAQKRKRYEKTLCKFWKSSKGKKRWRTFRVVKKGFEDKEKQ